MTTLGPTQLAMVKAIFQWISDSWMEILRFNFDEVIWRFPNYLLSGGAYEQNHETGWEKYRTISVFWVRHPSCSVFPQLLVTYCCITNDPTINKASRIAQCVKAYASQFDDLNLIHGNCLVEGETHSVECSFVLLLIHTHTHTYSYASMHTQRENILR